MCSDLCLYKKDNKNLTIDDLFNYLYMGVVGSILIIGGLNYTTHLIISYCY